MERPEDGVAVVGIGCNFPGGEGLENFWKVLVSGRNCAVTIPKERFDLSAWYDADDDNKAGKSRTAKAALIDGFNQFDHRLFGISDSEVEQMDPQQKQLLQCVYRALENAGIPVEKASGSRTGVYFGLMNRDYETNAAHVHPSIINHWTGPGLAMSIAANRVSYVFNFTGPSMAIDCACSSSLVALHLACQAIKQGDCDMAVCGGVNCIIEPRVFVALSKAKMISPDGTSKPFSNKADGYGRGEGCGVVLLKPLTKALQDQDHIWGIISKTAVNQDGHSVSPITKPSMTQQEELLRMIYSERDLDNVQYIEAHGTGTPVGDPTEAASLSNVIAKVRASGAETLRIGSVKSNIGHTESAAGVAGLIKVLLMMKHGTIVPSVFFSEETASVDFKALNMHVPKEVQRWEASGGRVAGINNFGFGGTNAHAIVTQHKQSRRLNKNDSRKMKYFVMSANSSKSLTLTLEDTIKRLENDFDLNHLLYTAACRRSHRKHKYRLACLVSSLADLKEKLQAAVHKNARPALQDPKLVFVFCGNGVTYHGMGKQLLRREPVFREKIEQISRAYQQLSSLNILDTLESDSERSDCSAPDVVQPLLFALQVGIATLLGHWGVKADSVLGHSVGEVAAAHCSGLLPLEDALKVIHFRSVLQGEVAGGKMLVISNMAVSEVTALLPQYSGRVCLAAFNSPQSCTLSGDADAIESLQTKLSSTAKSENLFIRVLEVPAAYHSHMMDPILPKLREAIGSLVGNERGVQLFSTVTGMEAQRGDFCSGDYWARNVREPVAFEQAVRSASQGKKSTVFVEIGPRRALQRNIMETLGNDTAVVASLQPDQDHQTLLSVISKLFELGVNIDWKTYYAGYEAPPLPFPRYQFDSSDRDVIIKGARQNTGSNHPVLCATGGESSTFSCDLMSDSTFYLQEHRHNKVAIIPGAFYAELGLAAFMACAKPKVPLNSLQLSVNFHSPFVLTPNPLEMKVRLEQEENEAGFTVFSSSATYASGKVAFKKERAVEEQRIDLSSIYKRCTSVVTYQEFYGYLAQGGFQYGEVFTNKADVHYGEDLKEAFAMITVPQALRSQLHDYCVHPVVLDFLMQLLPVTVEHIFAGRPGFPAKIGSLTVLEPLQDEMTVYLRATDVGADHFEVCGCFADRHGRTLVEVKHVLIKYLGSRSHVVEEYFYHNDFSVMTEELTNDPPPKALVFSDHIGIAKALQPHLDSRSHYISFAHAQDILSHGFPHVFANLNITDIKENFDEVLFLWGKENLNLFMPDDVLQNLASCCEIFRQVVLELKRIHFPNSVRAITYCSSELTVDHVNPGFAVVGMTRALAAEIAELSFQLVDISSICAKDIAALSEVLRAYPCSKYPELVVRDGAILKPSIARTSPEVPENSEGTFTSNASETCILQTADAFKMSRLSAVHVHADAEQMSDTSVEIQPTKLCVHSSEYFPVSASHLNFGQTLYWNKHSSQNHKLLMLDFSGIVTKVGKDVRKLKVGDCVASCYPVVGANRIRVPQDVCYTTNQLPFLQTAPCVSYFVLARVILCGVLAKAKRYLGIISPVPDSVLVKVLTIASQKSGWDVMVGTHGSFKDPNQMDAFVVLPPYNKSLIAEVCNFPSVKNVVLVRGSQTQDLLAQDELQGVNASVHVQQVDIRAVLQKGSLGARRRGVYHWLKSFNLNKNFSLESFTFQCMTSEKIQSLPSEKSNSYFHAQKVSVVALEKGQSAATSNIPLLRSKKRLFRKRSVYIVAGGLTGLGFETVKFISQKGGEVVITLSRSKPSAHVQQEIQKIQKQCGNSVVSMQCDVAASAQVHKVIGDIQLQFKGYPIRGVFHSAVVLHDALIESLDRSIYEEVLKPKVNGVLNLHDATLSCQLDYFVCYSSISAFLGNASQTNYAAANTFLDLFCQYRRKLGLPAQSINWGALNLGLLLNKEVFHRFLEAKGMMVLMVAEIHKSLEQSLLLNRPQQAICRFHFRNIRFNILSQNAALTMRLSALVEQALQKSRELNSQSKNTAEVPAKDYVVSLLGKTVGVDVSELKDDSPLSSLGTDSMQAMTLQNLIYQDRGVNVPLVKLLDPNATLSTVVAILNEAGEGGTHHHNALPTDNGGTLSTRF
ncbi:phthioceranic/hydroxyphthioceranic acid synthase-like [Vanacampus margaritifer]